MTQPVPPNPEKKPSLTNPELNEGEVLSKNEETAISVNLENPDRERVELPQELEQEEISPRQNTQQVLLTDSKAEIEADSPPTVKSLRKEKANVNTIQTEKKPAKGKLGGVAIAQAALTMLPILAIGTVTYVVGDRVITQQISQARRNGATRLEEVELGQQRQLLGNLLLGTGVAAIVAGAIFGDRD